MLREKGWGIVRIAEHFAQCGSPISANAINWQCMKVGADPPLRHWGKHTQAAEPYSRNGNVVKPYSAAEDALLVELDIQGFKLSVIARRMGRRTNSVKGRMMTLARREQRAEQREVT